MIESGKSIRFENLLSLRKKVTQEELNGQMMKIGQFLKEKNLKKNGPIINTTFAVEMKDNKQILDTELSIPVDREIELPAEYTFKKVFNLVNAICIRHTGNPMTLQNTYNDLNKFLTENKLQPITPAYNVTVNDVTDTAKIDEAIVDIYLGVNPNMI